MLSVIISWYIAGPYGQRSISTDLHQISVLHTLAADTNQAPHLTLIHHIYIREMFSRKILVLSVCLVPIKDASELLYMTGTERGTWFNGPWKKVRSMYIKVGLVVL